MLEALRHLLVRRNEELIDLDGDERSASGRLHRVRELLEDRAVHNLRVVRLEHLVTLDLDQVIEQVLHMVRQIRAKFLDRLARLHDLLDFLP